MAREAKRSVGWKIVGSVALLAAVTAGPAAAQPFDLPEDRQRASLLPPPGTPNLESGAPFDLDAHRTCAKECILRAYFEQGLDPAGHGAPPSTGFSDRGPGTTDPTDVLNNTLDIEVAPPGNGIAGSNTMTIRSNVDNLTTFTFRLRWNFTVTACTVTDTLGSYTVSPSVPVAGSTPATYGRTFTFARPINQGQVFTVRVDYNGALQSGIGLGSVFIGGQNGNTSNPGVVCTLSEPYYAGTWWPCKDGDLFVPGDNSDKATLNCSITAPDAFTSVSNGLLQGVDTLTGNRKRYRWATSYPMTTYLVFFSTTQYTYFTANYNYGTGVMPLDFYIYPINDSTSNRNVWLKVPDMLAAYRPVYGLYPFINEKYGIYQFEFSGGEEHQTFTGQGRGGAFSESVTSHELGHQWWGDNITCKYWNDIWLNEGFATYTEAIWEERKPGSTGFPALKSAMNARRPTDASGTVYCFDVANPGRIFEANLSYRKAGWVLHQLRHIVGETTFTNILQTYRATFEGGAATTAEFTAIASAVAGQNLDWFFNPWLYQGGAPSYDYGFESTNIGGQNYLRLMIRQTQSATTVFAMPIDVRITAGAGAIDTKVFHDARADYYLIPIPAPATAVTLDPDNWILEYGKASVAYIPGPPKVIALSPVPDASLPTASAPAAITIAFSDNVTATAADFALTRNGAPVPFTFAYSAATMTATLTPASPLTAGSYAVGVSDNVRSASGAIALDGELSPLPGGGGAVLPSGNGAAGGLLAYGFTLTAPPCTADFNHSGDITVQDIFDFLDAYFANQSSANINADAGISVQDIFDFLAAYFSGCP
jgi:hypothetical protein